MAATIDQRARGAWWPIGLVLVAMPAAADWDFRPYLRASEIYTDNVTLAAIGLEESEWVTSITPGFGLSGQGSRHDFELAYRMENLLYSEVSDRNETFHQADLVSNLTLVPDHFGLDFLGSYAQTIVDPLQPIPLSNVAVTANRINFGAANVNPYVFFDLGSVAELRIDYAYGEVNYADASQAQLVDDVQRTLGSFFVGSQPGRRFVWALNYSTQEAEFDVLPLFRYDRASLELGIPLGRAWTLVGLRGGETDIRTERSVGGTESRFWEAGLRWEPSSRTTIEARSGERFFGDTRFASLAFDGERLDVTLDYREDPTTMGLEQLGRPVINLRPGDTGFAVSPLTQDLYVNKQLAGQVRFERARSGLAINLRDVTREYIDLRVDENEFQTDIDWYWRFGTRSTLGIGVFLADIGFRGADVEDHLYQRSAQLDREMGERSQLSFIVRRERRSSEAGSALEYEENAFIVEYIIDAAGAGER